MNDDSIKELIESFIAYRDLIAPLKDSLAEVGRTYGEIRDDLDSLSKNLSGGASGQLDRIHQTLAAQAKNGQELSRRIDEYAQAGDKFAQAVREMTSQFSGLAERITSLEETEKNARAQIERIDALLEEKKASYNLKDLQKSLDRYNVNIEKISEFINRDIAVVMKQNADATDAIRKENDELKALVTQQNGDIKALCDAFGQTSQLLKTVVEGGAVNEQYIFDVMDKWAADRKVKTRQK